ncbi:uncharacterized protein LOC122494893 isoform X3 [Prionailurus bengalensis]|uniref:uncharacterized protein LOC122494893 isoform X3 n=1 Tax=Prionailurus bengalensis TaxID=37029 RepID=UPI001CA889D5|nr:uncharacterized protein LOC122494893 isoform X3 [Prionailurus bengalensis]
MLILLPGILFSGGLRAALGILGISYHILSVSSLAGKLNESLLPATRNVLAQTVTPAGAPTMPAPPPGLQAAHRVVIIPVPVCHPSRTLCSLNRSPWAYSSLVFPEPSTSPRSQRALNSSLPTLPAVEKLFPTKPCPPPESTLPRPPGGQSPATRRRDLRTLTVGTAQAPANQNGRLTNLHGRHCRQPTRQPRAHDVILANGKDASSLL